MPLPRLKIIECEPQRTRAIEWIDIEKKLNAVDAEWQSGEILKLENLKTIKYKETLSDVLVLAEVSDKVECNCTLDSTSLTKFGWTAPSMVLDSPIRFKRTSIFFRSQRFKCEECGAVIQSKTPAILKKHRLTQRLINYIEKASLDISKNFSDIAYETGVHEKIVRNIFTDHVVNLQENREIITPAWLAIDEVFPSTRKLPRCVISAPGLRKVVDLLEKNNYQTLSRWLLQLPQRSKVEVVSIDMYAPYRLVIRNLLPNAKIVVDRYHVHNLLNVCLKEVHQVIRASLTRKEQRNDYVPEHLLLKSRFHVSPVKPKSRGSQINEKDCLVAAFKRFPELARAYILKEDFSDILQLSNRQLAEERAESWLGSGQAIP